MKQSPLVWFFGRDLKDSVWLRLLTGFIWIGFVIMLLLSATDVAEKGFITAFCLAYARHLILRVQFAFDATTMRMNLPVQAGSVGRYEARGTLYATAPDGQLRPVSQAHSAAWMKRGNGTLTTS